MHQREREELFSPAPFSREIRRAEGRVKMSLAGGDITSGGAGTKARVILFLFRKSDEFWSK